MAKNLRRNQDVYQVRDNTGCVILYKGMVASICDPGTCRVHWLKPRNSVLTGLSTKEYMCDLYRSPKRAIRGYLKRVKLNLEIQQDCLEY